jgi:putative ABC transport system permease protein
MALSRLVAGFLYGVAPTDAATYTLAAALLVVTGLFATYLPARRAAAVDPMVALRQE